LSYIHCMTEMLTVRMPAKLVRDLKAKAKQSGTNASEVLREAAAEYVRSTNTGVNALQQHILARAGTWDGEISGVELLRRTRP